MASILQSVLTFFHEQSWFSLVLILFVIAVVASWTLSVLYRRFMAKQADARQALARVWFKSLYRPAQLLIWVVTLFYIIGIFSDKLFGQALRALPTNLGQIEQVVIVAFILWVGLRFCNQFESYIVHSKRHKKWRLDSTSLHAVMQLVRVAIILVAVMMMMQAYGISITSLLAFGGISGIAVGFAAKDTLANFLGSMMIYIDRPFSVGDWIRSPDRNIEGTVEHIGWRLTRIRTFDKRPLYVPNSLFSTISVENPSRMSNRRIKQSIGVRYDDVTKLPAIVDGIKTMLQQHPDIDTSQTLMVNVDEFAASSVNFFIYTFTKTTNWVEYQAILQDVLLKAHAVIEQQGAECAFPTQTLHINKPSGDKDVRD